MSESELSRPVIYKVALAFCAFGLFLVGLTGREYYQTIEQKEEEGYARALQQVEQVKEAINTEMQVEMAVAQNVADRLSSGKLPYQQVVDDLKTVFNQNPHFLGMAVGFAPYAYDPGVKLHAPYFLRDADGNISMIQVESLYDYTDPDLDSSKWYVNAVQAGAGVWVDPYYGKASDDILLVYSVPFSAPGDETEIAGVVVLAHSVSATFKSFMQNADLGYGGYLFLVNANNKITFHPELGMISQDASQVAKGIKGFDLTEALSDANGDPEKKYKGMIAVKGSQGTLSKLDTSWLFVRPLSNPLGWKMVVVINTLDKTYDPEGTIRQLTNLFQASLVFLVGLAMLVIRVDKMTSTRLMIFSVAIGTFFLIGILWVWYLVYSFPELNHQKMLVNDVGIQHALEPMHTAFERFGTPFPREIPTGILIENLSMTNQSIKISGYLWQKFPLDFPEESINFPQFTGQIGSLIHEEVYRYTRNNQQIVGWFFSTEIQQRFDNQRYPLDQAIIKIKIEPSSLSEEYILVPATLDYDYMGPGFKPGLASGLKVRGWSIKNSFFTYDGSTSYGTSFGLFRQIPKDALPTLVYNVRMMRDILSPLIAYCIIIYIVVMQVYGISILKIDNSYQVLSIAAALFLVVAITHNGLREALGVSGVVYLEYYFILLYLTILATSINAIMWAANIQLPVLAFRNNLFIKIVFWPAFLGIGLFFTLLLFYPFQF